MDTSYCYTFYLKIILSKGLKNLLRKEGTFARRLSFLSISLQNERRAYRVKKIIPPRVLDSDSNLLVEGISDLGKREGGKREGGREGRR